MKKIVLLLGILFFASASNLGGFQNKSKTVKSIIHLETVGIGVVPCNGACSMAQAKAMARRSAVLDAYKALAEKIYGIHVEGRDSVKNMILQNSTIKGYVQGLIRNAKIESETFKDGMYQVVMSVSVDSGTLKTLLKNSPKITYR